MMRKVEYIALAFMAAIMILIVQYKPIYAETTKTYNLSENDVFNEAIMKDGRIADIDSFSVSTDNPLYTVIDGVLYSKDRKVLIAYPAGHIQNKVYCLDSTTRIASYAFAYSQIESVVFPNMWDNAIREIGDYAFYHCKHLSNIYLQNSIEVIGSNIFEGCSEELTVIIGEDTAAYEYIDSNSALIKNHIVILSNELNIELWKNKQWELDAYPEEISFGDYWVNEGVLFFGNELFAYPMLKRDCIYSIPNGIQNISSVLCQNSYLEILCIPSSCVEISEGATSQNIYSKLTEFQVADNNPEYQDIDGVLYSKDGGRLLSYPCKKQCNYYSVADGTKILETSCFAYSNIRQIILPDTVTDIGYFAFEESTVEVLNIPASVTSIEVEAFESCPNIQRIIITKESYAAEWFESIKDYLDFDPVLVFADALSAETSP